MREKFEHIPTIPLAPSGLFRDFELDVLERLIKQGAKYYGCPIEKVECKVDGGVYIGFSGLRSAITGQPPVPWRGGFKMNLPLLNQKKAFADPVAVTECALQYLEAQGHIPKWAREAQS